MTVSVPKLVNTSSACFGCHLLFNHFECLFKFFHLFHKYGCAGIALYATCSLAVREVAAEIFLEKVE